MENVLNIINSPSPTNNPLTRYKHSYDMLRVRLRYATDRAYIHSTEVNNVTNEYE